MKAHRKALSSVFPAPAPAVSAAAGKLGELSELDLRILGELSKVRHSRLSDAVANCLNDRRAVIEDGLHRMLKLGLVRQTEHSKRGFKITEAGRAAFIASGRSPRSWPHPV